jgi:hypothetical protein
VLIRAATPRSLAGAAIARAPVHPDTVARTRAADDDPCHRPPEESDMTSPIPKLLTAASLLALTGVAAATPIDLLSVGPGTQVTVTGPCYCNQLAWFSPIMTLQPGTYDFGTVRDFWTASGGTPDGGPDQDTLFVLFSPMETQGAYPDGEFPPLLDYEFPPIARCAQSDAACAATYNGAYQDFDLTFTLAPGENAIQIALVGNYLYTPPVPEPETEALLVLGLGMLAGAARRARGGRTPA